MCSDRALDLSESCMSSLKDASAHAYTYMYSRAQTVMHVSPFSQEGLGTRLAYATHIEGVSIQVWWNGVEGS